MIRVFFETDGYSELAAVFIDEKLYIDCLPQLERMAKDMGFTRVTESTLYSRELITLIEKL